MDNSSHVLLSVYQRIWYCLHAFRATVHWIQHLSIDIQYYAQLVILTPIAYIFNQSFIIDHPGDIFPTLISPAQNSTIHSFYPSLNQKVHLFNRYDTPPPQRLWLRAEDLHQRMVGDHIERAITLEGTLSGPPLRQGMMVIQRHHLIFIGQELGRWPTHQDYIITYAVDINSGNTFPLFIPLHHIDRYGIHDDNPLSPLCTPIPLASILSISSQIPSPTP